MKLFARALLLTGLLVAACGGESESTKAKIAVEGGEGKGAGFEESISLAGSGNFSELRTINTPHNYANNYTNRWDVSGADDAIEMKVSFTRFELENNYDFITVMDGVGGQRTQLTGNKTGTDVIITGNRVTILMTTDSSVTAYGARMVISQRLPCRCPETLDPVCGSDGNTYPNECMATCEGVVVDHRGNCSSTWSRKTVLIESAHPYVDNFKNSWVITESGASQIRAHFSRIDVERGYDFVTVYDQNDRLVATYTGAQDNVTTPDIAGDSMTVTFESDYSVQGFGFVIDSYEAQGEESGYMALDVSTLQANPAAFNGRKISVTAEPLLNGQACTRIACGPSNPCCNQCSAHYRVDDDIYLEASSGDSYGCGGNECSWQSTCTPFTPNGAGLYELQGTFTIDQNNTKHLMVDAYRAASCARQGCAGQICANVSVYSTCDMRPEYACYAAAACGVQLNGHCGFTQDDTLRVCLASAVTPTVVSSADTPVRVPDNSDVGATSALVVPAQMAATPVHVSVDITHTYRGDLNVVLVSPTGTQTVLHDRTGGSYDNLNLRDINVGTIDAARVSGTWRLIVRDRDAQDVGTLDRWSLTLN